MEVFVSVVVAAFLVVGTSFSDPVPTRALNPEFQRECHEQTRIAEGAPVTDITDCYLACLFEKYGLIKDEKLVKRDTTIDWTAKVFRAGPLSNVTLKGGKTIDELAGTCFDTAKVKTEKCEAAGNYSNCIEQGLDRPKAY